MDTVTFAIHAALWVLGFLFLFHIPLCRRCRRGDPTSYPRISVIIPARNEETTLPNLLASFGEQSLTPDEIIVVDDQSEDGTSETADRAGVKVVQSEPLPAGWTGKTWACHQGAELATGDILIFLDADTTLERDGLAQIIDTFLEEEGVLSVQPYHRTQRLYEDLSSLFNLVMMGAIDAFTVFGRRLKPTALFGATLVLSRQHYVESGGHEKVKGKILEDAALARELRKQGIPIRCHGGKGAISFRMYPHGLGELVDGWGKGFALGAAQITIPSLLLVVAWIVGSIGAIRYLTESSFTGNTTAIALWGCLYMGYAAQIYWMLFRIGTFRVYTALLYPVSLLFFILVFARSSLLVLLRRRVNWKGRTIDVRGKVTQ